MRAPLVTLRHLLSVGLLVAATLAAAPARASQDDFADGHAPKHFSLTSEALTLVIKGDIQLELHDLEGEGGPGYDSPTDTRTLGTRSPFVEIDVFALSLRIGFADTVWVDSALEFNTSSARVAAVFVDYRGSAPSWLQHHVELGYHTPIVKVDRRTERYPLAGTSYWREPELHAAWEGLFLLGEEVTLELGASVAMMRPLAFAGIQDATSQPGTINVLSYGPAATFSGNGVVGGGRLRVAAYGAFIDTFGFFGSLAAEGGTDVLRSGFPNYRDLPGYRDEANTGGEFRWFGARVGYIGHGVYAWAEAVGSLEDLIRRWTVYGQVSYRVEVRPAGAKLFRAVEPLVRWESYRILDSTDVTASGRALTSPAPINAVSWGFDLLTLAAAVEVWDDLVRLRVEYAFVWEHNGVPALGIDDAPVRNDELLIHAQLRF